MKLSDLCPLCTKSEYTGTQYDEYGDAIKPTLCGEDVIKESVISSVLVQEIKQYDTMLDANKSIFSSKNNLYCGE